VFLPQKKKKKNSHNHYVKIKVTDAKKYGFDVTLNGNKEVQKGEKTFITPQI
jgi:hypothetical protein